MGSILRFTARDPNSKRPRREPAPRSSEQRFRYPADAEPVAEVCCDHGRDRQRAAERTRGRAED